MVVVILILLSLGVAGFIMMSDSKKNDSFKRLEQAAGDAPDAGAASHADAGSCDAGGDGGGGCD